MGAIRIDDVGVDTGMMYVVGMDAVRIDDVGVAAVEMANVGTDILVNYTIG